MRPDLLVASTPRSGSTMFAGMLNCGDQVCLYEPGAGFSRMPDKAKHLRPLGVTEADLPDWLRGKRWAVKEVTQRHIEGWRAREVVRLVRQPDQALLSLKRAFPRSNAACIRWWFMSFHAFARLDGPIVVYDKFVQSPAYRQETARRIGWSLDGDPALFLRTDDRLAEHEKHSSQLSYVHNEPNTPEEHALLKDAADKMALYRRAFGL